MSGAEKEPEPRKLSERVIKRLEAITKDPNSSLFVGKFVTGIVVSRKIGFSLSETALAPFRQWRSRSAAYKKAADIQTRKIEEGVEEYRNKRNEIERLSLAEEELKSFLGEEMASDLSDFLAYTEGRDVGDNSDNQGPEQNPPPPAHPELN